MSRFARNKDLNHKLVVETLRAMGCSVVTIESGTAGVPDLAVGVSGRTYLVEVKPLVGQTRQRELRATQVDWHSKWRGSPIPVLRTVEDVTTWVNAVRGTP